MGTPNLSTNANRRTDREKNIQGFFFFFGGFGRAGVGCCALYSRARLYIFFHWITLHFFFMESTSLKSFKNICSFNAKQFISMDCIELHCIANCWFAVHCNVLDWTASPTLHITALHWVKFLNILIFYKYMSIILYFKKILLLWQHCSSCTVQKFDI